MQVVVAGGTGLVGGHVLELLAQRPDVEVSALVRRGGVLAARTSQREVVFDFDSESAYGRIGTEIGCDVFFCCVGTTLAKAGSQAAFLRVDRDLPAAFVRRLGALRRKPTFALVSSVGASASSAFYLRVKAEVERLVVESSLPHVIVRPSLLLGERRELRPAERAATLVLGPLSRLVTKLGGRSSSLLGRYLPVEAVDVARALVTHALDKSGPPPAMILEGWALHESACHPAGSPSETSV